MAVNVSSIQSELNVIEGLTKIRMRRGNEATLPQASNLTAGEPKFAIDAGDLYVDNGVRNERIGGRKALQEINEQIITKVGRTFAASTGNVVVGDVNLKSDGNGIIIEKIAVDTVGRERPLDIVQGYKEVVYDKVPVVTTTTLTSPDGSVQFELDKSLSPNATIKVTSPGLLGINSQLSVTAEHLAEVEQAIVELASDIEHIDQEHIHKVVGQEETRAKKAETNLADDIGHAFHKIREETERAKGVEAVIPHIGIDETTSKRQVITNVKLTGPLGKPKSLSDETSVGDHNAVTVSFLVFDTEHGTSSPGTITLPLPIAHYDDNRVYGGLLTAEDYIKFSTYNSYFGAVTYFAQDEHLITSKQLVNAQHARNGNTAVVFGGTTAGRIIQHGLYNGESWTWENVPSIDISNGDWLYAHHMLETEYNKRPGKAIFKNNGAEVVWFDIILEESVPDYDSLDVNSKGQLRIRRRLIKEGQDAIYVPNAYNGSNIAYDKTSDLTIKEVIDRKVFIENIGEAGNRPVITGLTQTLNDENDLVNHYTSYDIETGLATEKTTTLALGEGMVFEQIVQDGAIKLDAPGIRDAISVETIRAETAEAEEKARAEAAEAAETERAVAAETTKLNKAPFEGGEYNECVLNTLFLAGDTTNPKQVNLVSRFTDVLNVAHYDYAYPITSSDDSILFTSVPRGPTTIGSLDMTVPGLVDMQAEIDGLKEDVGPLLTDVSELSTNVATLQGVVSTIEDIGADLGINSIADLTTTLTNLSGIVTNAAATANTISTLVSDVDTLKSATTIDELIASLGFTTAAEFADAIASLQTLPTQLEIAQQNLDATLATIPTLIAAAVAAALADLEGRVSLLESA